MDPSALAAFVRTFLLCLLRVDADNNLNHNSDIPFPQSFSRNAAASRELRCFGLYDRLDKCPVFMSLHLQAH